MASGLQFKLARAQLDKEPQREIPCPGAAHENPYIDNCGLCDPHWGRVSIPARFADIHQYREALLALAETL